MKLPISKTLRGKILITYNNIRERMKGLKQKDETYRGLSEGVGHKCKRASLIAQK
jgi:hypothetical protein